MKIIYLVNGISKTSIPWRWASYFNSNSSLVDIKMVNIKKFYTINHSVDIVHGHHIKAMFAFTLANIFFNIKTVYTVHGSYLFLSKTNRKMLRYIFKKSNHIVFVNKKLYDLLPRDMKNIIKDKYEIILNGVETNYKYEKTDVYKKFGINKNDTILFHPARFVKEKNHLRIISALKLLVEKSSNIKLVLAGDGKLKEDLKEHIKKLELEESVIMLGLIQRDEVYNFLEKCDLFLMPSLSEGLNIAFLEAISMKCRVLVSDIEQFVYPIEFYKINPSSINISFTNPLSKEDIADKIDTLLNKKRDYLYDFSDFSLKSMMKKYEGIYSRVVP